MKKICGVLLVIILIIFSSSLIVSADSITLYNRDEIVELENDVIKKGDDYFISLADLEKINIGYAELDENTLAVGKLKGYYRNYVRFDEKIIEGYNRIYENAVLVEEDIPYLSINALEKEYSEDGYIYNDGTSETIYLWINDYVTDTFWLNYSIDESIEIDENGFTVDLYYGTKTNMSYSSGGGRPLPEEKGGVYITDAPFDSDVHKIANTTINKRKTHTFTDDNREYTLTYDVVSRVAVTNGGISSGGGLVPSGPVNGGNGSSPKYRVAGIIVDTDKYQGGVQTKYSDTNRTDVVLRENNIFDYVSVKGSVTVPVQDIDLGYRVIAEGDRIENKTSLGSYYIQRKHVSSYRGIVSAGSSVSNYELKLVPGQDYIIYIIFDNGEYIRQYVKYEDLAEDKVFDFKDFEKSKSISGKIKLPDDISSLTGISGSDFDDVRGRILLQSDNSPYYIVDRTEFTVNMENKSFDFVLVDDIGMNNGYIHFRLYSEVEEIYPAGVYIDNTRCGYVIGDASVVSTDAKDLVINIAKGKVIETDIEYNGDIFGGEFYALVQEDSKKTNYKDTLLYVYGNRLYGQFKTKAVIPFDKSNYIPCFVFYYGGYEVPLYYDKETETLVDDFSKADVITNTKMNIVFSGYKPAVSVKVEGNVDDTESGYYANYITIGDYEYLGATRYVAYYGENNQLLHLETFPADFYVHNAVSDTVELDSTYYPLAKTVKMFIWHENINSIADVVIIKSEK